MEMTRDIWDGHDYIPYVFDEWAGDAGAAFQAAEVDGVVAGLQRLRPYARGLVWYEGLRVASTHRRRGIARVMLTAAVADARQQGFREMRLATRDGAAMSLFESMGFERRVRVRWWRGLRLEGGEPARMPDSSEARAMWPAIAASPGIELYGGISADLNGARDLGPDEVERLAAAGMLRAGPGARSFVGLREPWSENIAVAWVAGGGASLQDLLMALRYEADADGAHHVTINLPPQHPAEADLRATGYDVDDADADGYVYALKL